ncbi:hypothetical protein [Rhizobacter sp. SG703]|uniref:hypothetical protein n=1 Tax=Rhizobacter sp. SG703 TaxID=2587140 RepID=UPI001447D00F|nr:hypothetical protein [Rhizobacter sp. SG703]NKI94538.1 hypothetical protein [Rhizobacter sp. SG703]
MTTIQRPASSSPSGVVLGAPKASDGAVPLEQKLLAEKLLAVRREARLSTPAASGPLRILCAEIDNLKLRLSSAIETPGDPQEWATLLDTVRNSIPPDHGSLGLAFTKALSLAETSASKGDKANYLLGVRRLWTAFSMLQLTLSL